jgi:hypothetical protein
MDTLNSNWIPTAERQRELNNRHKIICYSALRRFVELRKSLGTARAIGRFDKNEPRRRRERIMANNMDQRKLAQVLRIQRQAFDLLLWLGRQARKRPELLSTESLEALRRAESCERWLIRQHSSLPRDMRLVEDEVRIMAHLLAAFFQTSFHVTKAPAWNGCTSQRTYTVLRAGAASVRRGRAGRRARKSKDNDTAAQLRLIAVLALAEEAGVALTHEQLDRLLDDSNLQADLNLWSYAWELHRRSQFASQGPAVHRLWQALDRYERERLDVDTIWQARDRLVDAIRHGNHGHCTA